MRKKGLGNDFLKTLPLQVSAVGRSVLRAVKLQIDQVVEFIRSLGRAAIRLKDQVVNFVVKAINRIRDLFRSIVSWVWSKYSNAERILTETCADIILTIVAFRLLVGLAAPILIGIILGWWLLVVIYVSVIGISLYKYYTSSEDLEVDQKVNDKWREMLVPILKYGLRVVSIALSLFLLVSQISAESIAETRAWASTQARTLMKEQQATRAVTAVQSKNPGRSSRRGTAGDVKKDKNRAETNKRREAAVRKIQESSARAASLARRQESREVAARVSQETTLHRGEKTIPADMKNEPRLSARDIAARIEKEGSGLGQDQDVAFAGGGLSLFEKKQSKSAPEEVSDHRNRQQIDSLADVEKVYGVRLRNDCRSSIQVSIHYSDVDKGWITKGWWQVPAGKEVFTGIKSNNRNVGFYAKAAGGVVWQGNKTDEKFKIARRGNFEYIHHSIGNIGAARSVKFLKYTASEGRSHIAPRFRCE